MQSFSLLSYGRCAVTEANKSYKTWARALLTSLLINTKGMTHPQTPQKHQYPVILQFLHHASCMETTHSLVHDENREKGELLLELLCACRRIVTLASLQLKGVAVFLQRWVSLPSISAKDLKIQPASSCW